MVNVAALNMASDMPPRMGAHDHSRVRAPGAMILWNPALCTGSDEIDHDHRLIVEMLNELAASKAFVRLERHFIDISTYLAEHFEHEESLQISLHYPQYERHHIEHLHMIRRIKAIGRVQLSRSARRSPESVARQVHGLMVDCIVRHVLTADLAMEVMFRDGPLEFRSDLIPPRE